MVGSYLALAGAPASATYYNNYYSYCQSGGTLANSDGSIAAGGPVTNTFYISQDCFTTNDFYSSAPGYFIAQGTTYSESGSASLSGSSFFNSGSIQWTRGTHSGSFYGTAEYGYHTWSDAEVTSDITQQLQRVIGTWSGSTYSETGVALSSHTTERSEVHHFYSGYFGQLISASAGYFFGEDLQLRTWTTSLNSDGSAAGSTSVTATSFDFGRNEGFNYRDQNHDVSLWNDFSNTVTAETYVFNGATTTLQGRQTSSSASNSEQHHLKFDGSNGWNYSQFNGAASSSSYASVAANGDFHQTLNGFSNNVIQWNYDTFTVSAGVVNDSFSNYADAKTQNYVQLSASGGISSSYSNGYVYGTFSGQTSTGSFVETQSYQEGQNGLVSSYWTQTDIGNLTNSSNNTATFSFTAYTSSYTWVDDSKQSNQSVQASAYTRTDGSNPSSPVTTTGWEDHRSGQTSGSINTRFESWSPWSSYSSQQYYQAGYDRSSNGYVSGNYTYLSGGGGDGRFSQTYGDRGRMEDYQNSSSGANIVLYKDAAGANYTGDANWWRWRFIDSFSWSGPVNRLFAQASTAYTSHQTITNDGTIWQTSLTTDRSLSQQYYMDTNSGSFWGTLYADDSNSIVKTANIPLKTTTVAQNETINITEDGSSGSSFYSSVVSSFKTFVSGVLKSSRTTSSASGNSALLAALNPGANCGLLDTALAGVPNGTTLPSALQTLLDAGALAGCLQPVADALANNPINAQINSQVAEPDFSSTSSPCPGVKAGQSNNTPNGQAVGYGQCGQGGANASSTALNPPGATQGKK